MVPNGDPNSAGAMRALMDVYLGIFVTSLLSATLLPGTSEAALAALIVLKQADITVLVVIATVGNVLGSCINWAFGRFLLHLRHTRWFPVSASHYDRAVGWFDRFGKYTLLFAWVPVVGDPLTVVAGALRVNIVTFLVLVTVGKAARYASIATALILWQQGF